MPFASYQVQAQSENPMQQAIEGYKNISSLTADVKRTVHNTMVTKDAVTTGKFYFKKPAKMIITTAGGKDKIFTDGETFSIVQNGKASSTSGSSNGALTPLVKAMKSVANGDTDTDLSEVADIDLSREGNNTVMTITPITETAAQKKKLVYQSFVMTIDNVAGQLKSIRLNGKGGNYEVYEFSNFVLNATVNDSVFKL